MRLILAKFFRFLFHFEFFRSKFFGIHQKIFDRFNLFRGQVDHIKYQDFKLEVKLDDWIQENLFFLGKYEEAELKVVQNILFGRFRRPYQTTQERPENRNFNTELNIYQRIH